MVDTRGERGWLLSVRQRYESYAHLFRVISPEEVSERLTPMSERYPRVWVFLDDGFLMANAEC
jgi:hypothetical protein